MRIYLKQYFILSTFTSVNYPERRRRPGRHTNASTPTGRHCSARCAAWASLSVMVSDSHCTWRSRRLMLCAGMHRCNSSSGRGNPAKHAYAHRTICCGPTETNTDVPVTPRAIPKSVFGDMPASGCRHSHASRLQWLPNIQRAGCEALKYGHRCNPSLPANQCRALCIIVRPSQFRTALGMVCRRLGLRNCAGWQSG